MAALSFRQRFAAAALFFGLALWLYWTYYRADWSHLAPVLLGVSGLWLGVDALQSGFEIATGRPRGWLQSGRWTWMAASAVGVAIILALMAWDGARYGFDRGDRTLLDVGVGVLAAFVRYFFRISFSHRR